MIKALKIIARTLTGLVIKAVSMSVIMTLILAALYIVQLVGLESIITVVSVAFIAGFLLSLSYDIGKEIIK